MRIYILLLFAISFNLFKVNAQIELTKEWSFNTFPDNPYNIVFDELNRSYFYASNDASGLLIFDYSSPQDIIQIAQINPMEWGGAKLMDVKQSGKHLYLAVGSFFDNNDTNTGIISVNIDNPFNPFIEDSWINPNAKKGSASVAVNNEIAVLSSLNDGIYIFDIKEPHSMVLLANFIPELNFPVVNPNSVQEPNARAVHIKDDLLFIAYDAGGLRVIDISNPNLPTEIHQYINPQLKDQIQQAYNNLIVGENGMAVIANDFCGLDFVDISDPRNIKNIGLWNPWECQSIDNNWINSEGHTNQLHFVPNSNEKHLVVNASDTELLILNISDLNDIKIIDYVGAIEDNKRTWGMGINDDYIALAYFSSLFPHFANESKIDLYSYKTTSSTTEQASIPIQLNLNGNAYQFSSSINPSHIQNVLLTTLLGQPINAEVELSGNSISLLTNEKFMTGAYFISLISEHDISSKLIYVE